MIVVFLASMLLTASPHHGSFYETLGKAIGQQDLESVRHLFTESAWEGTEAMPGGASIHKLLSGAEAVDRDGIVEWSTRSICTVPARFYLKDEDAARVFWLMGEKVGDEKTDGARAWRVSRITTDVAEVRKALGRDTIHSYLDGPSHVPTEQASAIRALVQPPKVARKRCLESAWNGKAKTSPRLANEELREGELRLVPRRVVRPSDAPADRSAIRTLLWSRVTDRHVDTRWVLLVREKGVWKVEAVTSSEKEAMAHVTADGEPSSGRSG
ncbi:MAG: hypothetical protein O6952_05825 [Planctomycetota bacterium]|nr:hypothetical protein [Planctomycetota bacterium]